MAKDSQEITITFTSRTILKVVFYIMVAFVFIHFLSRVTTALQLIFISFFLALALNPAVSWLSARFKRRGRLLATATAYSIVMLVLVGFLVLVLPPFIRQTLDLVNEIPTSVEDIQSQDTSLVQFIKDKNLTNEYTKVVTEVKNNLEGATSRVFSTVTAIGSGIISFITILVMTFMMLLEGPYWLKRLSVLLPASKAVKSKRVLKDMYRMVTGYVNGQLFIATVAAGFALVALLIASTILGVSINAVSLAFIVGIVGLIPMIGNTIAAVIVCLFCLFVSLPLAIIMAVFFLVYQQVENSTLQPYIQSKYNELTPLTVFVAAILGVSLAGFLGALVAIPFAGCVRIYLKEYYGDKISPKKV